MPIDERWSKLTESEWDSFAASWIKYLRELPPDDDESSVGLSVTMMGFTATVEDQWHFINSVMKYAESNAELEHIAAGPFEQLLSKFGAECIDRVEQKAKSDPQFVKMTTGAWQHLMADEIWERVQAIQTRCPDPLGSQR